MTVDLASLAVKIDATDADNAVGSLDKLAVAGGKAEGAVDRLGNEAAQSGKQMQTASQAAAEMAAKAQEISKGLGSATTASQQANDNLNDLSESGRLTAHELNQLAFQLNDLALQLASAAGSSAPLKGVLMALFQQGSQITPVLAAAGVSLAGFAKQAAVSAGILQVSGSAALDAALAQASANQAAIASALASAEAAVVSARAQQALAQAQLAVATTATETAAANARLVATTASLTAASGQAAIAQNALATANAEVSAASSAASAAQVTSLGRIGRAGLVGLAVVGSLAVAFKSYNAVLEERSPAEAYIKTLGLTDEQAKKLTDTHVTLGDTVKAAWQVFSEGLNIKGVFDAIDGWAISTAKYIYGAFRDSAGGIYAGFAAAYAAITSNWRQLPSMLGDVVALVVNSNIDRLQKLVNAGIEGLNFLARAANASFGTTFGAIAKVDLSGLKASYSAAGEEFGKDYATAYGKAKQSADAVFDRIDALALKNRNQRLADQAKEILGKGGKDAGKALAKGVKDGAEDDLKKFLAILEEEMAKLLKVIADQLDFKAAPGFERMLDAANEQFNKATEASRAFADSLVALQDIAGELDFGSIFGEAGAAIEDMAKTFDRLADAQKAHGDALYKAGSDQAKINKANAAYDQAKLNGTVALLGQTKRLFSEQSAGYKAVEAAEKAAAALAAVNTIKHVAAGAAKIFAQLGPWAFPVVGAMVAVMAGLGFSGGGGSSYTPPSAEDMQAKIGTGTVLGDSGAQSESLANALQILADNSNADLEYSNEQVRYLREISAGIGNLTSQIARQVGLGAGGMFSTSGLNLGTSGSSGVLGLFGSSTTRTLYDQGIDTFNQQIGDILAQGVQAQIYNIVQTVKKKSGFLGIGGGTSTSYTTTTGTIDNSVSRQFGLIIGDIQASITDMITGLAGNTNAVFRAEVENYINNMVLPGTRLSFEGMSGDEIEKALNAYFSSVADTITMMVSGLAIPDLAAFQQAGEGLYETLARVTRTMATVSVALKSIGMGGLDGFGGDFSATGRVTAATNLSDQFGGLDALQEAIADFSDTFLTEAERMAPVITSVRDEMARLGVAGVTTNDQFKALVQGLDLSTASGQSMFAQLLAVAPAFAKVTEYLGDLNGELVETGKTAAQLAQIEKDRRALSIQIMELTGNAEGALAAKRADQLAALDETLRPLQEQVFALQDQKTATEAAAAAAAELAAAEQRVANERSNLETRLLQLQGNTAALRERELAALDPSNRALLASIFAFEDATAAAQALADAQAEQTRLAEEAAAAAARIADERYGLETRLLQTQGDTVALRERELAALDPSNRAILSQIFALEDAKAAAEAQAAAQAEATRVAEAAAAEVIRLAEEQARIATQIANERFGLETRLLTLHGNTATLRERELAALDPSNRALQLQIYALEDQAAAATVAAQAAQEQARIEAEAAQAAKAINDQRAGLERQILELQGDTAALRALELASLDPSNRALQERIYAIRDEQAASQAATQAAQEAAQAEAERQRALEQAASAIASEIAGLDRQLLSAQGNVAALRALDLAGLLSDEARARQLQIWAIEDAKAAADALAEANAEAARAAEELAQTERAIAEERYGLELRLLEALGDASGALALRRAQELAGIDASNRALLEQIYAAEDAAVAAQALADAQAEAARIQAEAAAEATRQAEAAAAEIKRIADERYGLETRLLQVQGNTAALRERELAALDPSNRAILAQIFALEDQAAAAQAAAQAQDEANKIAEAAAAEATRQAEAAAAEAKRIADERYGLETQLLTLQGDTVTLRARELALLDPTNQALQQQIWAMQDAAEAATAAANAQAELARQQDEAAKAAEQLRKTGVDLQIRYFETLGDTAAATALRRREELAAADESHRSLLMQIYALEDAKTAQDAYNDALAAHNDRIEAARDQLAAAYQREAGSLQETIDKFRDFGASLRDFRAGLFLAEGGTVAGYQQAQATFLRTSAQAASGDAMALAGLAGSGTSFLEASRAQASTLVEYQRDVAMVARSVDTAIGAADQAVDYAELQLEALDRLVGGYIDLNENVLTVAQALAELREAQAEEIVPATVAPIVDAQEQQTQVIRDTNARLEQQIISLEATVASLLVQVADKLNNIDRREQKYDRGDFKAIGNDRDTPVTTVTA